MRDARWFRNARCERIAHCPYLGDGRPKTSIPLRAVLFHITHTHAPERCLYRDPKTLAATFGTVDQAMEAAGATVIGSWVDAASHTFFWVVDAERAEQVNAGLDPIVDRGHATTRPITDLTATIASRQSAADR